ncbi:hypothetical protein [Streptomyces spectabilis]|uniref:Uncharacterized protein n=1 Tax=Streptomyces spectabilis TaxID=68270 RepID=A0A5P2XCI6_STRST|nr:hypothetical protein [Streptomyces spectabilis]MBB5106601.1 hypothetical protein [Streptomyces spectabilis]MCI3903542.1 hypothetical protein [Streptomyces spectabilis]QEV60740.1 hypothetical protein CP982_20100 [Streptomyces spectabilis]GGV48265.1 hypothetical protein GCM10010245_75950 [Streptomyces spectabilis]
MAVYVDVGRDATTLPLDESGKVYDSGVSVHGPLGQDVQDRMAEIRADSCGAGDSRTKAANTKATAYAPVTVSAPRDEDDVPPGRKQRLEIQIYADGRWQGEAATCFKLHPDGTSGDNVSSTTHGAWQHLYVTR